MHNKSTKIGLIACVALAMPALGHAQKDPNFVSSTKDKEAAEKVEWAASAQAGVIFSTGNTEQTVLLGGAKASRKQGFNKFQIEANGSFARTSVLVAAPMDSDGDGVIDNDELGDATEGQTTSQAWDVKARYDRFLTEHNSVYISALASGDKLAGKVFVGGTQIGYSRQLYKDEKHEITSEVGYDFSYEKLDAGNNSIHSARLFLGYVGKLTEDTGLTGSVEALMNVNELEGDIGPFEDTRSTGKLELTTKVTDDLSLNVGVTAKYDNAPAPRTVTFQGMDFTVQAGKLDTTTKATLIFNFL